jgi:hypothetical protein
VDDAKAIRIEQSLVKLGQSEGLEAINRDNSDSMPVDIQKLLLSMPSLTLEDLTEYMEWRGSRRRRGGA